MKFDISDDDFNAFLETYVLSRTPLKFKEVPAKEKRKYMMLCMIIHHIDPTKIYHEFELNDILKPMVDDYVMIRRYLVDYGFLNREIDGSKYWVDCDLTEYSKFNKA
ncbi:MAG: hypothetical protein A2Y45_06820 [Tenericutes bacterium GWC2_34_14]|nr:MAG: hypothetical protein A2Z84_05805 [Tenericutes bacterium GWA2_35_7]OHE28660.1 MAG: hypothetical protein A2Y45_06820 [Tenericutes bacterium GWC2_34_14]OHE33432.1 MAG: hypothetical protein A2012_02990 [Tenericutes bacterium GWE2_34_108]OHE36717.1 MAG: hypothetical protein A2Y46_08790 [Tenericutes bacterium GWF1_35_14]OHE38204.1 MAG: hypothetical protein A2Y44_09875 [Tenericutes bacterium GWF2_35_184]OHE41214.1 MAG: hypothetical protein A3K26_09960 [Tenericutes bacterium RIFOXYA12_FULL_35_